ncbi:cation transporting ATPase C-terminal domain-containing protein [Vreelandella alkaliphila]|uniref:cation transporting ATPase C-terminal domain-containing protein n=1 Tax=Halomonadaceae TaxID=28256 RepID=UPI001E5F2361|nr:MULTISPECIES: cation transporting ATPase C-terminal domain-containing protein [Halomonas]MCD6003524.1 cation transporting ATPase C-terminal domain-containing protein [Halomonas sp. IOP_6]
MANLPASRDGSLALFNLGMTSAALGIFFYSLSRGDELVLARTLVVNVIVVLEIFYLFNVRYLHMSSFNLLGVLRNSTVLIAITVVFISQLAFTYLPIMHSLFDTRPLDFMDGLLVISMGIAMMCVLETEKYLVRRGGWFDH